LNKGHPLIVLEIIIAVSEIDTSRRTNPYTTIGARVEAVRILTKRD